MYVYLYVYAVIDPLSRALSKLIVAWMVKNWACVMCKDRIHRLHHIAIPSKL